MSNRIKAFVKIELELSIGLSHLGGQSIVCFSHRATFKCH